MTWSERSQKAVDAFMAWLHWHDVPKSQAFFIFNIVMAVSNAAGALLSAHIVPSWWVPVVAIPGGFLTGIVVREAYSDRKQDRIAEEVNSLTWRDVPAKDSVLRVIGSCALVFGVWSLLFPHDIAWTIFFVVFWLRLKARASPRYPKPPEKRVFVPAHSTG
jgi:hypothetical protein